MIRELCHIVVKPGTQAGFEAAVQQALAIFKRSKGCHQVELHHVIEKPEDGVDGRDRHCLLLVEREVLAQD